MTLRKSAKNKDKKTGLSREARRKKTIRKLLNSTIDLLLESGYSKFRSANAAAKAGVSRGALSHHFATKEELIEAAIRRLFDNAVALAEKDASNSATSEIVANAAKHADLFLSGKLYQVSFNILISVGELEHLAEGVRNISAQGRVPIEHAWISRIEETGMSAEEADVLLGFLWSLQRGLAVEHRIGSEFANPEIAGDTMDFVCRILAQRIAQNNSQADLSIDPEPSL